VILNYNSLEKNDGNYKKAKFDSKNIPFCIDPVIAFDVAKLWIV
jgi:hypothetical protein